MSYFNDASLVLIPSGYKTSKVYSVKPDTGAGDFTFSRASDATRINSSGLIETVSSNVPRLDYTNSTCPRILLESQRTNLVLRSEEFNNAAWTKLRCTVAANVIISPDGTLDADGFVEDTTTNSRPVYNTTTITVATATVYTFSIFAKKGSRRYLAITPVNSSIGAIFYDFDNKTTSNAAGSIIDVGNGWYRLIYTYTSNSTTGIFYIEPSINGTGTSYLGNGSTAYYLWGAQLEAGAFVSTYIPTTSAAVTRLKDDVAISGASALIGQTEGTVFIDVDFRVVSGGGIRVFFNIEGSVTNQFTGVAIGTTSDGNNVQGAGTAYTLTQGRHKIIYRYNSATNVSKLFVDGAQRGASTFAAFAATIDRISVLGRINPFSSFTTDRQQFGGCNQFVVFKTALTDAQCIELSTL